MKKHSHYFRSVAGLEEIDVYRILDLFKVTDPCLQHIVKKALCAGQRGAKDAIKDVSEIRDTAERFLQMREEDGEADVPVEYGVIAIDTAIGEWPESSAVQPETPAERTILRSKLPDWVPADAEWFAAPHGEFKAEHAYRAARDGQPHHCGCNYGWIVAGRWDSIDDLMITRPELQRIIEDQPSTYGTPDADGFYPWSGGECPVAKGVLVDVRYRCGEEIRGIPAMTIIPGFDASSSFWIHDMLDHDIIGWKFA